MNHKFLRYNHGRRNEFFSSFHVSQFSFKDSIPQKAEILMLQGKTLNVLARYDPVAQEALEKAVKLDPRLVEAWIQLGEVYWKNNRVEDAKNCFTGALNHVSVSLL